MKRTELILRSRKHYWRYYRLVVGAVILMMAVLTGSLLLGDSVRGTLADRVSERLGKAETVIASGTGFLDENIMENPLLANADGYLLVDCFVSVEDKLLPVYVWGTDKDSIPYGEAMVNEPLAKKMSSDLILNLPSHNLVPSGTLFVTKSYATKVRLKMRGVKDVEHGGNLLLKNEQTLPLNVFMNRRQLCEVMELEGKVNVLLSEAEINEEQLQKVWRPSHSGIHITGSTLTCDRIFISENIVKKVNSETKYFSYLVNDIINGTDTVPYSFVTASTDWKGNTLTGNDMVLSDYAAKRLRVSVGDSVSMSYFLSRDLKNLATNEKMFKVKDIIPLAEFQCDTLLTAEFPGLSNVERCTDWDSDLPIKMDRVHKIDEDFWYAYRNTPKAIVAYDAVCDYWCSSFGTATALRLSDSEGVSLTLADAGVIVKSPRAEGLYAATHGTDFSSLFMALGFFIIVSAILLMQNPLYEMLAQRRDELQLYSQLGFKPKDVRGLIFKEAFSVMLLASPFGVLAGVLYSGLTLWLLGNVWSGATHTEGFALHVEPLSLLISWLIGIVICACSCYFTCKKR